MITKKQLLLKRVFDIVLSFIGILFLSIPIFLLIICASLSTKNIGVFSQIRVGQKAKLFTMYKIRTMRSVERSKNSELQELDKHGITVKSDERVTYFGRFLRRSKLDELPQLFNVFIGDMSIVGPRPDIQGYADSLKEDDGIILIVKPGITGPATLAFRNEELLLSNNANPIAYNSEVVWPQKVKLNVEYVKNWSFKKDLIYIYQTIFS